MLGDECMVAARAIASDVAEAAEDDGSLRGTAAALVLFHELGHAAPRVAASRLRRWEAVTIDSLFTLEAEFFDGMLGAAWALARTGRGRGKLGAVDAAVLDVLAPDPWDGGLAPFGGGLAGFGLYGLARMQSQRGRQIVRRCVELFDALATRDGAAIRWSVAGTALPAEVRGTVLCNMEGSAAAVAFLAAAARAGLDHALETARNGARTLAADFAQAATWEQIGAAVAHAAEGLLHGRGTWALGSAGAISALLGAARASGDSEDLEGAARVGRQLADVDPDVCDAVDASLGSGTAGIACVMRALFQATAARVFRISADYWILRTLRARTPGAGLGGYVYFDPLHDVSEGGSRWQSRLGMLEGATGTALALLGVARRARSTSWCSG